MTALKMPIKKVAHHLNDDVSFGNDEGEQGFEYTTNV
jgi:hypothetical protein